MQENSLTFRELIATIAQASERSQRSTGEFMREMIRVIEEGLRQGERIDIHGFGSFHLKRIQEHDPITGQWRKMKEVEDVEFSPSADFVRFLKAAEAQNSASIAASTQSLKQKGTLRSKATSQQNTSRTQQPGASKISQTGASTTPQSRSSSSGQPSTSTPSIGTPTSPLALMEEDELLLREIDPIDIPESMREALLAESLSESEQEKGQETGAEATREAEGEPISDADEQRHEDADFYDPSSIPSHRMNVRMPSFTRTSPTPASIAAASYRSGDLVVGSGDVSAATLPATVRFQDMVRDGLMAASQSHSAGSEDRSGWSKQAIAAILFASAIAFAAIYQMRSTIDAPSTQPSSRQLKTAQITHSSTSPKAGASSSTLTTASQAATASPVTGGITESSSANNAFFPITTQIQVQRGQSLWSIAQQQLGDPYLWPWILSLNPEVSDPNQITAGQTLTIPVRPSSSSLSEQEATSVTLGYLSAYDWLNEAGRREARDFLWAAVRFSPETVRENLLLVSQRDLRYVENLLASLD